MSSIKKGKLRQGLPKRWDEIRNGTASGDSVEKVEGPSDHGREVGNAEVEVAERQDHQSAKLHR